MVILETATGSTRDPRSRPEEGVDRGADAAIPREAWPALRPWAEGATEEGEVPWGRGVECRTGDVEVSEGGEAPSKFAFFEFMHKPCC